MAKWASAHPIWPSSGDVRRFPAPSLLLGVMRSVAVNGGDDLNVTAGADSVGGGYFVGLGTARLSAGGGIANLASGIGALAELGDARVTLRVRGDVTLGSSFNPSVVKQRPSPIPWLRPS